jgi:hypothetical protein
MRVAMVALARLFDWRGALEIVKPVIKIKKRSPTCTISSKQRRHQNKEEAEITGNYPTSTRRGKPAPAWLKRTGEPISHQIPNKDKT